MCVCVCVCVCVCHNSKGRDSLSIPFMPWNKLISFVYICMVYIVPLSTQVKLFDDQSTQ